MTKYIYAWNQGSRGASDLAAALGVRRIRHEGSTFRGGPRKTVINWGSSQLPTFINGSVILNRPETVALVSDKLRFFQAMAAHNDGPRIPPFTTDRNEAIRWVADGNVVCARTILRGHSAAGLVLMDKDNPASIVDAPLYTKYVQKKEEYRVHVVRGQVIDVQRKALRADVNKEDANWKVRNLANGFIFARNEGREPPRDVIEQSLKAFNASGLDFGAIDVIYRERDNEAYILEINSAPGLQGTTLTNYAEAFAAL